MSLPRPSNLVGQHAFLSASSPAWLNYDVDKLQRVWYTQQAAKKGSDLHDYASRAIRLGVRQAKNNSALSRYINDAIGYRMKTEQLLYYSPNAFGTADAIGFRRNVLRIFDYKSGLSEPNEKQVEIYVAFYCLEYRTNPSEIDMDLRIYQHQEPHMWKPSADLIFHIIDKIKTFDRYVSAWRADSE